MMRPDAGGRQAKQSVVACRHLQVMSSTCLATNILRLVISVTLLASPASLHGPWPRSSSGIILAAGMRSAQQSYTTGITAIGLGLPADPYYANPAESSTRSDDGNIRDESSSNVIAAGDRSVIVPLELQSADDAYDSAGDTISGAGDSSGTVNRYQMTRPSSISASMGTLREEAAVVTPVVAVAYSSVFDGSESFSAGLTTTATSGANTTNNTVHSSTTASADSVAAATDSGDEGEDGETLYADSANALRKSNDDEPSAAALSVSSVDAKSNTSLHFNYNFLYFPDAATSDADETDNGDEYNKITNDSEADARALSLAATFSKVMEKVDVDDDATAVAVTATFGGNDTIWDDGEVFSIEGNTNISDAASSQDGVYTYVMPYPELLLLEPVDEEISLLLEEPGVTEIDVAEVYAGDTDDVSYGDTVVVSTTAEALLPFIAHGAGGATIDIPSLLYMDEHSISSDDDDAKLAYEGNIIWDGDEVFSIEDDTNISDAASSQEVVYTYVMPYPELLLEPVDEEVSLLLEEPGVTEIDVVEVYAVELDDAAYGDAVVVSTADELLPFAHSAGGTTIDLPSLLYMDEHSSSSSSSSDDYDTKLVYDDNTIWDELFSIDDDTDVGDAASNQGGVYTYAMPYPELLLEPVDKELSLLLKEPVVTEVVIAEVYAAAGDDVAYDDAVVISTSDELLPFAHSTGGTAIDMPSLFYIDEHVTSNDDDDTTPIYGDDEGIADDNQLGLSSTSSSTYFHYSSTSTQMTEIDDFLQWRYIEKELKVDNFDDTGADGVGGDASNEVVLAALAALARDIDDDDSDDSDVDIGLAIASGTILNDADDVILDESSMSIISEFESEEQTITSFILPLSNTAESGDAANTDDEEDGDMLLLTRSSTPDDTYDDAATFWNLPLLVASDAADTTNIRMSTMDDSSLDEAVTQYKSLYKSSYASVSSSLVAVDTGANIARTFFIDVLIILLLLVVIYMLYKIQTISNDLKQYLETTAAENTAIGGNRQPSACCRNLQYPGNLTLKQLSMYHPSGFCDDEIDAYAALLPRYHK